MKGLCFSSYLGDEAIISVKLPEVLPNFFKRQKAPIFPEDSHRAVVEHLSDKMTNSTSPGVTMYDIRNDKTETSLLGMIKQGLSSEPKTLPTLLLYDGADHAANPGNNH